ncbi:unnamed protein product [Owenia fusiformis]|uniref:Phosphotransferase n=1 Tax=Owenia fusiformis TaxID=6347 RepID=A0A8J1XFX7_OWEFU|nr:unnamed protein product [Owenia fusiformis]
MKWLDKQVLAPVALDEAPVELPTFEHPKLEPEMPLTRLKIRNKIRGYCEDFEIDNDGYKRIMNLLEHEMDKGLGKETNAAATIKMFPTYVRSLPDGSEEGNFLALDLGGTNFRVLLITLHGGEVKMESKIYLIPQYIMQGSGNQLFDHLADCCAKFMKAHAISHLSLPLGFTFSFPCKQHGIASASLQTWTKGFKCAGVEGEDVVRMFHEAVKRRKDIDITCVAILNDTVGTLMSCAHDDHNCEIGLILGTGTNACYMEKLDNVELWDGDDKEPKQVIINTEWGAFGDNKCLDWFRTPYDKEVDEFSLNGGKQVYEKMISGMYMGEIARLVILKLTQEGLMFGGEVSEELETRQRFYTKYISEIESDDEDEFRNTKQVLEEMGIETFTIEDCRNVRYVCEQVSTRAAYLASAGIAVLLNKISKPEITVAVDGSLYKFHPKFHDRMVDKISTLVNPGIKFKLMMSNDGSGKGAALVAAVAYRILQHQRRQLRL